MQDGGYHPASKIPIKRLIKLNFRSPTARQDVRRTVRFVWRIALLALKVKSHGAVYLHHRRRGFLAREGAGFSGTWCTAAGAWLQGPASQARSLSQSRSRNDVAVPARRSVRD